MPNSAPPVLTRSGVVPGNEARLPHYGIEGFVSEGVIRTVVFKNAEEYHTVVARCRRLNFDDLMDAVSKTDALEFDKAVSLVKWFPRFSKVDAPHRSSTLMRGSRLKEAIRFYPHVDDVNGDTIKSSAGTSTADRKSSVTNLGDFLFYVEKDAPFARHHDMPLPETVIPGKLQEAIGISALTSDALRDTWFSPLPIEIFAECISHHSCLYAGKPEDELMRVKVLTVLSREYMRRQGADRSEFGGLCHSLLAQLRCIPFDSDQPTQFAADYPADCTSILPS